jgi:hypothetical protein
MSDQDVKVDADPAKGTGHAGGAAAGIGAHAEAAMATGTAPPTPTRVTAGVEGIGPKRAEAHALGRGGPTSHLDQRIASYRAKVAERRRDGLSLTLSAVALALGRGEEQVARDVHKAGWQDWRLFVQSVPRAD